MRPGLAWLGIDESSLRLAVKFTKRLTNEQKKSRVPARQGLGRCLRAVEAMIPM